MKLELLFSPIPSNNMNFENKYDKCLDYDSTGAPVGIRWRKHNTNNYCNTDKNVTIFCAEASEIRPARPETMHRLNYYFINKIVKHHENRQKYLKFNTFLCMFLNTKSRIIITVISTRAQTCLFDNIERWAYKACNIIV